jgi:hypothetical protein
MIDEHAPIETRSLAKYRGAVGTIVQVNVNGVQGCTRIEEFPNVLVNEVYLIPIDDDDDIAFERFMKKLNLHDNNFNPWLQDTE